MPAEAESGMPAEAESDPRPRRARARSLRPSRRRGSR